MFFSREKWEREQRTRELLAKASQLADVLLSRFGGEVAGASSATDDVAKVLSGLLSAAAKRPESAAREPEED